MAKNNHNPFSWRFIGLPALLLVVLLICIYKFGSGPIPLNLPLKVPSDIDETQVELDEFIPRAMHRSGVPGMTIALIHNEKIQNVSGYGSAGWLTGRDIDQNSVFEAASLSKPMTAWAILQLVDQGKLSLDSVFHSGDKSYTIRQLLSHTAGFDNKLGKDLLPTSPSGNFSYAGQGYIKLGQIIEATTQMKFEDYMNDVVLTQLNMTDSYFGEKRKTNPPAAPHISISMMQLTGVFLLLLTTIVLTIPLWVGLALQKKKLTGSHQQRIFWIGCVVALVLPIFLMGVNNGLRMALVNALSLALILVILKGLKEWNGGQFKHEDTSAGYGWTTAGFLALIALLYTLWYRPPVTLKDRADRYAPAAGLKTTVSDYAQFMIAMMEWHQAHGETTFDMFTAQVKVNEHNAWGLGVGVQQSDSPAVWHWGVNYPGFQALFVMWPDNRDGAVILMNGGQMSLTNEGIRYSGLEMARNIVAKVFGGQHFDYWQNIN